MSPSPVVKAASYVFYYVLPNLGNFNIRPEVVYGVPLDPYALLLSGLYAVVYTATLLLISTAVEKVAVNFGKPEQKWLDKITLAEAKAYLAEGIHFAKGSMAPKIQAVIWYLEDGGKQALITNPENIGRALKGETGTWIVK